MEEFCCNVFKITDFKNCTYGVYADDLESIINGNEVHILLENVYKQAKEFNLQINEKKSAIMPIKGTTYIN